MGKQKLIQKPAFPLTDGNTFAEDGMSKRFYAACAAMVRDDINTELRDEDMVEDKNGYYIKSGDNYLIPHNQRDYKRYSIKTSYEKRLARGLYALADELLKQEENG